MDLLIFVKFTILEVTYEKLAHFVCFLAIFLLVHAKTQQKWLPVSFCLFRHL